MIKKHLFILSSLLLLFSCDQIGGNKIKSLVDLTPKLAVENDKAVHFSDVGYNPIDDAKANQIAIASSDIISEPAVAKKVFYSVEKSGFVTAYSLKEKKQLWRTNIKGDIADRFFIGGGILYSNGKLYVTNGTRYLTILDATTGIEEFRKEFSDIIRTRPVMAENNKLLIQTVSNKLYAINSVNFRNIWVHEGGIQTISSGDYTSPILFENVVIASFSTGELLALDINTGQPRWRYLLTNHENITLPGFVPATIKTQPIVHNDFMYFATANGKLVKIYLYTGLPAWTKEVHDIHSMMLHSDKLLVTNNARQLAIIDASNGEVNWVGNLITEEQKQKKKIKAIKFLEPSINKTDSAYEINVPSNNGTLYSFTVDASGNLSVWPSTSAIAKKAKYQWLSCCDGKIHLITNRKITNEKVLKSN